MDKILAVDDDTYMRALLRTALANHYEVLEAGSGEEALSVAVSADPRLILLDVMMPGMSGHEVCSQLRRNPKTCHTIIVMLTVHDREEDVVEGLAAGADDYLVKPFKISELKARIDSHLRRQWRELQANPLSGLPGNNEIDQVIRASLKAGIEFAVCYADISYFKSYNDKYGFSAGDQVLVFCADLLTRVVGELGDAGQDFVGHIGGDDFIIISAPERIKAIAEEVVERFDVEVRKFYAAEDLDRGGIETIDRLFKTTFAPIISVSLAIVISDGSFSHPGQIAQTAAEVKGYIKRNYSQGSTYMVDRRSRSGVRLSDASLVEVPFGAPSGGD
ncbi:MAG TPA: response regulator [Blastocatellia bacterium]|nr:response regulator [Blastocatellia bacterium]